MTVPGGFTIEQGSTPDIRIQKIGTPAVLGRDVTYYITVSNMGNVDSGVVSVGEIVDPWFTLKTTSPLPTTLTQLPDLFPPSAAGTNYDAMPLWTIASVAAGTSQTLAYTATLDPAFPLGQKVTGTACRMSEDDWRRFHLFDAACYTTMLLSCGVIGPACVVGIEACDAAAIVTVGAQAACIIFDMLPRGSVDPNDLTGPLGIGVPRWIPGSESMQYIIEFENLPAATKDATDVTVTDNLNPSLFDLSTLAVGAVSFGSSAYVPPNLPLLVAPFTTDIDLRPSRALIVRVHAALNPTTGQVTVTFVSIDPATGLPPSNPLVGFLPPGVGGSVFLTVMPKTGLVTGTTIQNQATVVFDFNPPINTPIWSNTIGPTVQCTGCYFTISGVRATLAFDVREVGSGSTFSYNYRTSAQTVQFVSTTTSQIAVNGKSVTFSGQGKLNGQTGYSFTVTAMDGGAVGSALDTVSIKITGPNNYSYTANGSIAGGDIVVKQ